VKPSYADVVQACKAQDSMTSSKPDLMKNGVKRKMLGSSTKKDGKLNKLNKKDATCPVTSSTS